MKMRFNLRECGTNVVAFGKSAAARVGVSVGALAASGLAAAQSTSPGSAIAGELAGGKADQMLIIGAVAIMLGVLIVWAYVKRAR